MKNGSLADKIIISFLLALGMAETGHLLMVFGHRPFSDAVRCFVAEAVILLLVAVGVQIADAVRDDGEQDGVKTVGAKTGSVIRSGEKQDGVKTVGAKMGSVIRSGEKQGRVKTGSARRDGVWRGSAQQNGARRVGKKGGAKRAGRRAGRGFTGKDITPRIAGINLVFLLLVLFQLMTITSGEKLVLRGDQTIETVESMLETDGIYTVNPLTGRAYTAGVPKRIQILGLPTFYGILCRLAGVLARDELRGGSLCGTILVGWVPLAVLCLTYLAYWTVAKVLFPERRDKERRMVFLVVVAAVFCAGNYVFGLDGFGLLYCGYRGVTIRNGILLPYTVGLMLRDKWKTAVLCILAEACIVWTLYGMGVCVAVALGMAVVRLCITKNRGALYAAGEEV